MQTSKQTPKQSKQNPEWISKEDGAARLGRTVRTLQEYISSGQLKTSQQRADSGQLKTFVHAGDLERIIYERENPPAGAAVLLRGEPRPRVPSTVVIQAPAPPVAEPGAGQAWLTIERAAEYTGLPASYLVAMIEGGILPALNVGTRPGGRWRVCRADLDALRGERLILAR